MQQSSASRRKTLWWAASKASIRSDRLVILIGSVILMRKGSMMVRMKGLLGAGES